MSTLKDKILKSASESGTKIQSDIERKLETTFNRMFYLEKDIKNEIKFLKNVMTRGQETQERVGLHASSFIHVHDNDFCVRELVLSLLFKQRQSEQISPGLKRIFEEGNAVHEKWQRLFIRAGYSNWNELDETQYYNDYKISFTPDIICSIPSIFDGEKMLGEIKSVNTNQFDQFIRKNKTHPTAGKQLQWYMFLSGIHKGFVLNDNKNNQDFKIEFYEYDEKIVLPFVEKAEEVIYYYERFKKEKKMVKRPSFAKSSKSIKCNKCAMRDACWNIGMGRIKIK